MISTITLDTYKQQISSGDAFNLSDSFNGRVGDEQVPLVVHFKERGLAQQFQDGLAPFLTGFVGSLDENDQVTAETGEAVSYVGTSDDIVGLGRVKMNLPGTMFPQEGYFYGFLGLQNADGKRVTTFNIWFHVYNGNPDMFVNKAPFRTELQKLLDESEQLISKTDGVIQAKLIEWQNAINKLITDGNTDLDTYKQRVSLAEDQLNGLTAKIAANDIPTKADLNKTIADLTGRLDDLDDQFTLNPVNPWMTAVSPDIEAQLSSYETTINKADGVVRILNLQDTHTSEAAIGDAGYQLAAPKSINQIQSLSMIADDVDLVVANGDNIHGNETKAMNIHRNQQFVDTVHGVVDSKPVLITLGNHDDGSVFDTDTDVLTLPELTDIMSYSKYAQGENRPGGTATYSYYDFKIAKLRVISLDGFENPEVYNTDGTIKYKRASASVFTEAQLKWLVQALTLDAGWHVIIFNHSPFKGFYGNAPYSTMTDVNHDVLNQILQAFANATTLTTTGNNNDFPVNITADFSKQAKGMLIACVFGHEHRDAAKQVINGVPAIERTCDIAVGEGRTVGTVSAYGVDVIEVDTVNKTINFNRFGAGSGVKWTF
ncbi:MAG: metallophosphoesterase [Lactiplantibacillus plantarum]|nr:metallophosphoesterase [Lactiplantibacillus plantarum]MDN6574177.1 metallophosphoesterase [Lactiplantibacillus plantarum]